MFQLLREGDRVTMSTIRNGQWAEICRNVVVTNHEEGAEASQYEIKVTLEQGSSLFWANFINSLQLSWYDSDFTYEW